MPKPRFAALDPSKREKLLRAAAEEFAAHGYAGASYNRILEHCGVSKGAAYYYFEDKSDLYITVLRDCAFRSLEFLGPPEPVESVAAYWREVASLTRRSVAFYRADPCAAGLVRNLARAGGVVPIPELRDVYRGWTSRFSRRRRPWAGGSARSNSPADSSRTKPSSSPKSTRGR